MMTATQVAYATKMVPIHVKDSEFDEIRELFDHFGIDWFVAEGRMEVPVWCAANAKTIVDVYRDVCEELTIG